ncbi:MAG TPA: hypothetical protein VGW74_07155, partial [Propionibacteriaceae bacterium]|nr:hypothetical protein [Propionibacteriaceae bacterium]
MIIGGGVALDLAPEDWSADPPDARLLLVVRRPAVAHQLHDPQWSVVSGLRYQSMDDLEPVRVTVK